MAMRLMPLRSSFGGLFLQPAVGDVHHFIESAGAVEPQHVFQIGFRC